MLGGSTCLSLFNRNSGYQTVVEWSGENYAIALNLKKKRALPESPFIWDLPMGTVKIGEKTFSTTRADYSKPDIVKKIEKLNQLMV